MRPALRTLALVTVLVAACASGGGSGSSAVVTRSPTPVPGPVELTIFGAASLKAALEDAASAYETANVGTTITLSTGSSAALATQIVEGAPADVFLSADQTNPQKLVDADLASDEPLVFAANELAIIVPTGNPAAIASPADLARAGVKVIAAGDGVPITAYATELLGNLAGQPGYADGFEAAYAGNVASREEDVKAVVARIELGEGDVAIVYATDAAVSTKVETIEVPDGTNVRASYSGVVLKASDHPAEAQAFLVWLAGPDGQAILSTHGFLPPES